VRVLLHTAALPHFMIHDATQWVARREEEEDRRELDYEEEQRRLALAEHQLAIEQKEIALRTEELSRATERVARRTLLPAWIAAAGAIVAVIIGVLAWLFPR